MQFYQYDFKAMGSPCLIQCYSLDEHTAQQVFAYVHQEVARLERKYSRYLDDSLLSQINQRAGSKHRVAIDQETFALLNYAQQAFDISDGLFDITSGVLGKVWDFKSGKRPTQQQLAEVLPLIGWQKVQWDEQSVSLPQAGMAIDMGGIVKEYAVDRAVALLSRYKLAALVSLGGDIGVTPYSQEDNFWQVAIRHPRKTNSEKIATIPLSKGAVAASGDYERFIEIDGKRYSHILNPLTGYPVADSPATVSIWANHCVLAGTLTTIATLKGTEAINWLNSLEVPYVCVDYDMLLHTNNLPA